MYEKMSTDVKHYYKCKGCTRECTKRIKQRYDRGIPKWVYMTCPNDEKGDLQKAMYLNTYCTRYLLGKLGELYEPKDPADAVDGEEVHREDGSEPSVLESVSERSGDKDEGQGDVPLEERKSDPELDEEVS